jgi:hypothetical protein
MRNETKIRSRIVFPKAVIDGASTIIPAIALRAVSDKNTVFQHLVLSVFHDTHVDMQAEPALPAVIFGAKVTFVSISKSQVTNHPFGNH